MTIEQLFEKAAHDKAFFEQLQADPAKALQGAGTKATPAQLAALKEVRYKALVDVATAFGSSATNIT
jgi:hypothetical protein